MNNEQEVIPVFFAVDDSYAPFLTVALQSLVDKSSPNNMYTIKVLCTNMSDENQKIISSLERENINIEFVDLNYYIESVQDKLYTRDYYSKTTYFRLFLPELYPQYKKALYLDSDIVLLDDVANLYNIDIGDNLVAAVPDGAVQNIKEFQEYVEKVVGVADYKNYFNAGILLMNLEELRKFDFQNKFMYLLETVKFTVAQDQDYLNRLCKGRAKILDSAWNTMPLPTNTIDEKDIKLIHYNLAYKPWHFEDILYKEYFWHYAKKTVYHDRIKQIKNEYTPEQMFEDREAGERLIELAKKESDCVGDDRRFRRE